MSLLSVCVCLSAIKNRQCEQNIDYLLMRWFISIGLHNAHIIHRTYTRTHHIKNSIAFDSSGIFKQAEDRGLMIYHKIVCNDAINPILFLYFVQRGFNVCSVLYCSQFACACVCSFSSSPSKLKNFLTEIETATVRDIHTQNTQKHRWKFSCLFSSGFISFGCLFCFLFCFSWLFILSIKFHKIS